MKSYREKFGKSLPPAGTHIQIKYMEVVEYYIVWVLCPDLENILYRSIKSKALAIEIANNHEWIIC
ncbi:hypothetical protein HZP37_18185 [Elizabethkingia anophelis]|nr:hypothetical protein [Elizabethkingia anophelis]